MRKLAVAATLAALLVLLLLGVRAFALHALEHSTLHTHRQGSRTPAAAGLAYEAMQIKSGPRTLRAFFVSAQDPRAPALLVFHGNGESISGWVPALKLLHDGGLTAMVFDYSGFGDSDGPASVENFAADGVAAWQAFRARLPPGTRACAYGLSLGSAVLLSQAAELQPPPDCVAVSGSFPSVRAAMARSHRVPAWASWLLPDLLDGERGAARLRAPLLVEHGTDDQVFPVEFARRIQAARPGAELVIVPGMRHADPVAHPSDREWAPIVRFVAAAPR